MLTQPIEGENKMVANLNDRNFESEVLKADRPVLVDFYADWCQPCRMATPVIEELAEEYSSKIKTSKLDVEESPQLAGKYGVMSIPTVIIFKDGKEVKRQVGFPGKAGYQQLIDAILND